MAPDIRKKTDSSFWDDFSRVRNIVIQKKKKVDKKCSIRCCGTRHLRVRTVEETVGVEAGGGGCGGGEGKGRGGGKGRGNGENKRRGQRKRKEKAIGEG